LIKDSIMLLKHRSRVSAFAFSLALLVCLAPLVEAVDGVVLIDQNRALAGNVTPGDLPGFPVTISRAGSYRLSGNLDIADPDAIGIEIMSNDVTLDLNGFKIQGPADACSFTLQPVWCSNPPRDADGIKAYDIDLKYHSLNVAVYNGTVRAMAGRGLLLGLFARAESLRIFDNRGIGLYVGSGLILNNIASGNGDDLVYGSSAGTTRVNNVCGIYSHPC
jgi:hypothetical protein